MGVPIGDGMGVLMDAATIYAIGNEIMSDATDGVTISAMGNEIIRWETDGATIRFVICAATGAMIGAVFCGIRRHRIGEKNYAMKGIENELKFVPLLMTENLHLLALFLLSTKLSSKRNICQHKMIDPGNVFFTLIGNITPQNE